MISVHCSCGKGFTTHEENVGKKAKCPRCGVVLTITPTKLDDDIADLLGNPALNSTGPATGRSHAVPPGAPPVRIIPPVVPSLSGHPESYAKATSVRRKEPTFLDWDSSVFVGLLDLNFSRFITPAIIKSLYVVHMVFIFFGLCLLIWSNYRVLADSTSQDTSQPALMYLYIAFANVASLLVLFIVTLIVRLCLEAVMVLFRGEEHLRILAEVAHGRS